MTIVATIAGMAVGAYVWGYAEVIWRDRQRRRLIRAGWTPPEENTDV